MTILTHGLADFPFGLFLALGLAAIPLLFSLGKGQFALSDAVAEINPQGYECQALLIHFSFQFVNLLFAEEQFPRPERPMVKGPSGEIFADMDVQEPNLALTNHPVSVPEVGFALAQRFNFGAKQHHARFQLLK